MRIKKKKETKYSRECEAVIWERKGAVVKERDFSEKGKKERRDFFWIEETHQNFKEASTMQRKGEQQPHEGGSGCGRERSTGRDILFCWSREDTREFYLFIFWWDERGWRGDDNESSHSWGTLNVLIRGISGDESGIIHHRPHHVGEGIIVNIKTALRDHQLGEGHNSSQIRSCLLGLIETPSSSPLNANGFVLSSRLHRVTWFKNLYDGAPKTSWKLMSKRLNVVLGNETKVTNNL